MTNKEFHALKVEDKVNLPFSIDPIQIVVAIDYDKNTISSRPADDELVTYINNYVSIEVVPEVKEEHIEIKKQILAMFEDFRQSGCNSCPFHTECQNVYDETRAHSSTATLTICEALMKTNVKY